MNNELHDSLADARRHLDRELAPTRAPPRLSEPTSGTTRRSRRGPEWPRTRPGEPIGACPRGQLRVSTVACPGGQLDVHTICPRRQLPDRAGRGRAHTGAAAREFGLTGHAGVSVAAAAPQFGRAVNGGGSLGLVARVGGVSRGSASERTALFRLGGLARSFGLELTLWLGPR